MTIKKEIRRQLLADIATLYYKEKETQAQIGKKFGYSRSAISRLLCEAEQEGIFEIIINFPLLRDTNLERQLKERYCLDRAFVINTGQAHDTLALQMIGQLGALYLEQELYDDMIVGVGWGSSLYELVNALPYMHLSNIRVVQVIGALGSKSDARMDGPDLAAFMAKKLNADHQFLHSPYLLDSEEACATLKSQKQIKDTLDLVYQADLILLGIGTVDVDPHYSSIFRSGFFSKEEILDIKAIGGVGHFCGLIIDENGKIMDIDINRRVMAIDLNKIKPNGRKLVGLAAGARKSRAIEAVLNGGWLDVLITDQFAVNFLSSKLQPEDK